LAIQPPVVAGDIAERPKRSSRTFSRLSVYCWRGLLIRRRAADCVSANNRFDAWRESTMRASGEAINPARFAASIIVCEEENVVPTKWGEIEAISG
jgi:hypothetical protein